MRGNSSRSSKKREISKQEMEIDDDDTKLKEEEPPHLSGAYIRSLVKQLTTSSSRPKHQQPPKDMSQFDEETLAQPPPQHHKKQVRRRLHTSRPYQERLLNMAEARREIVTALKLHRAAMKQQANENHHKPEPQISPPQPCFEQQETRRNPAIYPSYPFSWQHNPLPLPSDNLNFPLPDQTLGLNLNFHDFTNIVDTNLYHNPSSSVYSSSSPSSSSSPEEILPKSEQGILMDHAGSKAGGGGGGGLHQVLDDEEMAEIRSLGEQHEMEWNDTMNLVTSAWWFKFMKTMEIRPEEVKAAAEDEYDPFVQVMEFPAWLNTNDGCLQQHFNDSCSPDYFHHPSLPCMDIGEIEGMDGEWLA